MVRLNIRVEEQVSLSKLQREKLVEAGLVDSHICTTTRKESYEELIKYFLLIHNRLGLQGGNKGNLGSKEVINILALLSQTYLIKFHSISRTMVKYKFLQEKVNEVLTSLEKGFYDNIAKRVRTNWGKIQDVDEIFTKGSLQVQGKISIAVHVADEKGESVIAMSQGHVVLKDFLHSIEQLISEYEQQKAIVSDLDFELHDIIHEIEFFEDEKSPEKDEIKRNRRARRKAKDRMELLEPLYVWYTENGSINKAEEILSSIATTECYHRTREYSYKSSSYKGKGVITHSIV